MTNVAIRNLPLRTESKKAPKSKPVGPIEAAIRSWAETLPVDLLGSIQATVGDLVFSSPRRWVVYPPMILLPSGSFRDKWWTVLQSPSIDLRHLDELWRLILDRISKKEGKGTLTHLAVNGPIPLQRNSDDPGDTGKVENFLRTPSGLVMLYGDFGPALEPDHTPSERDIEDAFWVRTKQNGITQIWAPRYTMFSRGNVTEKQRLLDFHGPEREMESRARTRSELKMETAVDLYAGIGYFVFSYVKMGMGRVLGWELNPWSVEGLRRGALANGWSVRVIKDGEIFDVGDEKIIVMQEDNRMAGDRIRRVERVGPISHINCGLLPTSEASWEMALGILSGNGWLHLHDNVGVKDILGRKDEVEEILRNVLKKASDDRELRVEHMETVKSFAPGVFHMVFDVYVYNQT
jgi:tRNA wybutosine-synthesizing protein 2